MSRNLIARIAVSAVAIPIILTISYQGGWWLLGMVSLLAVLAMIEYLTGEGYRPNRLDFWLGLLTIILILTRMGVVLNASAGDSQAVARMFFKEAPWFGFGFFLVAGMLSAIGRDAPDLLFKRYVRLFWGVMYVGLLYPFVFLVGETFALPYPDSFSGGDCLLLLFGVLWVGDTAAMGVGKWIGKSRLAPTVSPNKTVEGFVGGLVGAAAIGIIMVFWKFDGVSWYNVLLMALGCSLFGQLGDLVESMWKRSIGIKDSSAIIPGHGGILDRFDSLLFAAPFMYFYVRLFVIG